MKKKGINLREKKYLGMNIMIIAFFMAIVGFVLALFGALTPGMIMIELGILGGVVGLGIYFITLIVLYQKAKRIKKQ